MTATVKGPHREEIKAMIRMRYGSLAEFERVKGLPRWSCRDVLIGKSRPRIAQEIANAVGIEIHKLFPGRYTANGDTIIRRRKVAHRLSDKAA